MQRLEPAMSNLSYAELVEGAKWRLYPPPFLVSAFYLDLPIFRTYFLSFSLS
jgi:hypothetical protein